jgi:Cof subfamily protein (haloacid dehalogenase superfamily)
MLDLLHKTKEKTMSQYKVLFLDIDGTIITPDDKIEDSTIEAVSKVQEQGVEVFLATGRPIHEILDIAKNLKINSFIGYNGAYGVYKGDDLYQDCMPGSLVENYLKIVHELNHEMVLYTNNDNVFTSLESPLVKKFIKKFQFNKNELYTQSDLNHILGITLINVNKNEAHHYLNKDGIHLAQVNVEGLENCFDVIRDHVNKGFGVNCVLKHLGIGKEAAIAFGDGLNDKEMLMNVGESFAMGNAHPKLFSLAKHKTTAVGHSGILNGLKTLGLIKE